MAIVKQQVASLRVTEMLVADFAGVSVSSRGPSIHISDGVNTACGVYLNSYDLRHICPYPGALVHVPISGLRLRYADALMLMQFDVRNH